MDKLKKKINFLTIVILLLVLIILIMIILFVKNSFIPKCEEEALVKKEIHKNEELDNYEYIGIYNYEEDKECGNQMNLVLTSDYSAIFYVGDCHNKSYYYGKYRIVDNKINLYSLILEDSTNDVEMYVEDDGIYFNLTEDSQYITSSYGRSESVRLKKCIMLYKNKINFHNSNGIYTNHIFGKKDFIMNKMMWLMMLGAAGYGGFMLYKKYNPDYMKDMKKYVDKMANKVSQMSENMM